MTAQRISQPRDLLYYREKWKIHVPLKQIVFIISPKKTHGMWEYPGYVTKMQYAIKLSFIFSENHCYILPYDSFFLMSLSQVWLFKYHFSIIKQLLNFFLFFCFLVITKSGSFYLWKPSKRWIQGRNPKSIGRLHCFWICPRTIIWSESRSGQDLSSSRGV